MKRVLAIACVLVAAAAVVLLGTGAGDGDAYRVRAIFDNAFSVIPGEDVKVAGVKVGKVESLEVTRDQKAAVVLRIDRDGFQDFRRDAECTIRPQSLIGERFVECDPTQPRPDGTPAPPALRRIDRGSAEGQYLLPVQNTSRPVDLDLITNVMRLPEQQRLSIIITELGTALAGRGPELRQAIRNASPALKETDRVLAILGQQNQVLEDLAVDSDRIMAPLARDRARAADFVDKASTVATAAASRDTALQRNIERLPELLRQLRPTMQRLGGFADEATPVLADLDAVAPDVNSLVRQLGPFSRAAEPAVTRLGTASVVGRDALVKTQPIIEDLGRFARTAQPLSRDLQALLTSVRDTGGLERALDYIFYQVAAINGFDSVSHYLRAGLIVNTCSQYAISTAPECTAKFQRQLGTSDTSAGAARTSSRTPGGTKPYQDTRRSPDLRRLDAYLRGLDPDRAVSARAAPAKRSAPEPSSASASSATAASQPVAARRASAASDEAVTGPLLDYLIGG